MPETDFGIVLFRSTQSAIKAERALLLAGLTVKLIPTPRQYSSSCGTAVRSAWGDVASVRSTLKASGIQYQGIRKMTVRK